MPLGGAPAAACAPAGRRTPRSACGRCSSGAQDKRACASSGPVRSQCVPTASAVGASSAA